MNAQNNMLGSDTCIECGTATDGKNLCFECLEKARIEREAREAASREARRKADERFDDTQGDEFQM